MLRIFPFRRCLCSAATLTSYHVRFTLSTTFFIFFYFFWRNLLTVAQIKSCLLSCSSATKLRISPFSSLVNTNFVWIYFAVTLPMIVNDYLQHLNPFFFVFNTLFWGLTAFTCSLYVDICRFWADFPFVLTQVFLFLYAYIRQRFFFCPISSFAFASPIYTRNVTVRNIFIFERPRIVWSSNL